MSDIDDFYEEDEPVEDVVAAWDSGEKGTTAPPFYGFSIVTQSVQMGLASAPTPWAVRIQATDAPASRGSLARSA